MKPISLTLEGVNSFVEAQTVDFERLAQAGLFGVFGRTGSGKSTVLDGITLALYGKLARSSDDFIHTGCDSASVSFRFAMSGQTDSRYLAERVFARDPKTGKPRTKKARLALLDGDGAPQTVLAEDALPVNNACARVIGLCYDDFLRTIVLPQGRFSEFLLLTGSKRNEMLERLFRLDAFGETLMGRLKRRIARETEARAGFAGALSAYADLDDAAVQALRDTAECLRQAEQAANDAKAQADAAFAAQEKRAALHKARLDAEDLAIKAQACAPEMARRADALRLAKAARALEPAIRQAEDAQTRTAAAETRAAACEAALSCARASSERLADEARTAQRALDEHLPPIEQALFRARQALQLTPKLALVEREAARRVQALDALLADKTAREAARQVAQAALDTARQGADALARQKTALGCTPEHRDALRLGLQAEQAEAQATAAREKAEQAEAQAQEGQRQADARLATALAERRAADDALAAAQAARTALAQRPIDSTEQLIERSNRIQRIEAAQKEAQAALERRDTALAAGRAARSAQRAATQAVYDAQAALDRASAEQRAQFTQALRQSLRVGEPCPVCGARVCAISGDCAPADSPQGDVAPLQKALQSANERLAQANAELNQAKAAYAQADAALSALSEAAAPHLAPGASLAAFDLDALRKAQADAQRLKAQHEQSLVQADAAVETARSAQSAAAIRQAEAAAAQKNASALCAQARAARGVTLLEAQAAGAALAELRAQTGIPHFRQAADAQAERDRALGELETALRAVADQQSACETQLESLRSEQAAQEPAIDRATVELSRVQGEASSLRRQLTELVDDAPDIPAFLDALEADKARRTQANRLAQNAAAEAEKALAVADTSLADAREGLKLASANSAAAAAELARALAQTDFPDAASARAALRDPAFLDDEAQALERFEQARSRAEADLRALDEQLGGAPFDEAAFAALGASRQAAEVAADEARTEALRARLTYETACLDLGRANEIRARLLQHENTLALLAQLKKLFEGKRFVQYVAASRLSGVAAAASETLHTLSRGAYGLVADNNAFEMVDYKNGGARRDPRTLSGGETFLASLALALALSAQIQLTNDAPLELFFLDEGFGTLDDDLLGEVFDALERLPNERRAIGLISHVEAIKNRMPIRLQVDESLPGVRGSRVHIEFN